MPTTAKTQFTETLSSKIILTEEILIYVFESFEKIKIMAIKLESNCENALKALYCEKSQNDVAQGNNEP